MAHKSAIINNNFGRVTYPGILPVKFKIKSTDQTPFSEALAQN